MKGPRKFLDSGPHTTATAPGLFLIFHQISCLCSVKKRVHVINTAIKRSNEVDRH